MQIQGKQKDKIIIGSFPFRGTMQSVRLLCEYIGVEYQNKFFNPIEWQKYKQTEAKDWLYKQIPFLKCGDLVLTNGFAAAQFIVDKFGRYDLLGTTQEEKLFMHSAVSFYSIILGALSLQCELRDCSQQERKLKREKYWKQTFYPKFYKVQQMCHGPWFLSHLSIIDFFMYEDYLLFSNIYPEMKNLTNFRRVYESVGNIPVIKAFEKDRSIKQKCPNSYFRQFREEMKKNRSCKVDIEGIGCFKNNQSKPCQNNRTGFCPYKKDQDKMIDQ